MKLEHLLLGILLGQPGTGYDLKRYFDAHGRFVRPRTQMSQIYRCLSAMDDRGLVGYEEENRPGAQNAKIYSVTSEGAEVFLRWLTSPYHPPSPYYDHEFNARLSFSGFMTREQLLELLDHEVATRREQVAQSRHRERHLPRHPALPFDAELADAVAEAAHEHGAAGMDAHIRWVAELADAIRTGDLFMSDKKTRSLPHS